MKFFGGAIPGLAMRELRSSWASAVPYVIIIFFILPLSIWLFEAQHYFALNEATLRPYFSLFPVLCTIAIPALTMRSWAEERKSRTLELLLTFPLSEWELVLGKFFAAYGIFVAAVIFTLPLPLGLMLLGRFDLGVLFSEYLGVLFFGSGATALGLLCSALAKNQINAFLLGFVILLSSTLANQAIALDGLPAILADSIAVFSLAFHYETFSKGVLDSRDISYFIFATALPLFLNTRVLLYRKWS